MDLYAYTDTYLRYTNNNLSCEIYMHLLLCSPLTICTLKSKRWYFKQWVRRFKIAICNPHIKNSVNTKGSCQVKNIPKIREKLGLSRPHTPTRLSIFLIFFGNMYNEKTKQKNTIFPKKRHPSWGLTHPPTSEFFSDFWNFFNLTKPLTKKILRNC